MSTIDNYGIQYGTGELFPQDSEGGTADPNNVTQRRYRGGNQTVGSTATGGTGSDNGQDLLNAIQMGNLGTGAGVYSRRESNTFYFKSLAVENGLTIRTTGESIVIGGPELPNAVELPRLDIYLSSTAQFATSTWNKILRVKADGTGIEFVDMPTGGGSGTITVGDTSTIDLSGNGLSVPVTGVVKVSAEEGNAIKINADGLFVAEAEAGTPGAPITVTDTATLDLTVAGSDISGAVKISAEEGNGLEIKTDGLFVAPGEKGEKGEDGKDGTSLSFKGAGETVADLPDPLSAEEGDAWIIAKHVWILTEGEWVDGGEIAGPQGPKGDIGPRGPEGDAGVVIIGPLANEAALAGIADPRPGDGYWINAHLWVFVESANAFVDMGDFKGPQGDKGGVGNKGDKGDKGDKGEPGTSVTGATVNNDSHLIIALSKGGPIDAGQVSATKLVALEDVTAAPTASDDGKVLAWDNATSKFILKTATGGTYTVSDTASVDLTLTGTAISAAVKRSGAANNALVENADGLYVAVGSNTVTDTASIDLTLTGTAISGAVKRSATANNRITEQTDGLHVAPVAIQKAGAAVTANPSAINFTGTNITVTDVAGVATVAVAAGGAVPIQDEGTVVQAAPTAINFVGAGVTTTTVGTVATVTIPGGSGGGASSVTWKMQCSSTGATFAGAASNIELPAGWTYVSSTTTSMTVKMPAGSRVKLFNIWGDNGTVVKAASIGPTNSRLEYAPNDPTTITYTMPSQTAQGNLASNAIIIVDIIL